MDIVYFGHATFLININGKKVLFDPFNIKESLQNIFPDYILITHAHFDHIENAFEIAKTSNAKIVSNFEITNWFKNKGIDNIHGMNIGGSFRFDFGQVKMVHAAHSSVFIDGTYGGNACGYVISNENHTIYYAGDTGLSTEMKLLGENQKIDYAFLPIGDNYTMGIEDAVIAADYIKCENIIAMHFDTFPAIKVDKKNAENTFKSAGKNLILPAKEKLFKI